MIQKYTLDMPVCSFCIDKNDNNMFASTMIRKNELVLSKDMKTKLKYGMKL